MKLTKQQIFDFVWEKLEEQGKPSYDEGDGTCVYEDSEGNHCAARWLIPEGHRALEVGGTWASVLLLFPDLKEMYEGNHPLITKLQNAHDFAQLKTEGTPNFLVALHDEFSRVAKIFNLSFNAKRPKL